jgi:hypothetical protein
MRSVRRVVAGTAVAVFVAVQLLGAPGSGASTARRPVGQLRIVNYYPANAGWTRMWTSYSHARTVADFRAIASLGGNAVRIIVQPQAVGYPSVKATMLSHFHDMLAVARSAGLSVQLTLFDWWGGYTDVAGSVRWLRSLLAGESGNPTIALVELKNEIPTTSPTAMTWASTLLPYLAKLLPGVPRTVSASGTSGIAGVLAVAAQLPPTALDVIDVHYYGDPAAALPTLLAAKSAAVGRPVIVGEAGRSSAGSGGEEAQAQFFRLMAVVTQAAGLPPAAPWVLDDFTSSGVPRPIPAADYHFGLRRTNGTWKPVAAVVRQMFSGQRVLAGQLDLASRSTLNWDGGFEREHNGGLQLGSWSRFDPTDGVGVVEHRIVRSGSAAVCFSHTGARLSASPSVAQAFPVLRAGSVVRASAWVRRAGGTGREHVALAWFSADGRYRGQVQSPAAVGQNRWERLTVAGVAPAGAVRVAVHLKAAAERGTACYDDASISWA